MKKLRGFHLSYKPIAPGAAARTLSCNLSRYRLRLNVGALRGMRRTAGLVRRMVAALRPRYSHSWPRARVGQMGIRYAAAVNLVETILVFAVIPLAIFGAVGLSVLRSKFTGTPRYRPGQPWEHPPMWWSANPDGDAGAQSTVPSGTSSTARGGASGKW